MTTEQAHPAPRQDNQDPALFGQTPSQTVGPFFHYGLPWKGGADLVGQSDMGARPELFPEEHYVLNLAPPKGAVSGEVITLEGVVLDADGKPAPDVMVEIWQANAAGRYASPEDGRTEIPLDEGFIGFGRASTSEEGLYRYTTVTPGDVPGPGNSQQAPHIAVSVFGRGVIKRLATRVYFEGQAANAADPILALVPAERRDTLLARKVDDAWRFDIILQGARETVFFDL